MNEESLLAALDRATTWSSYVDAQLSATLNLTNARIDPERARECARQALHGVTQLSAALTEYELTWEQLSKPNTTNQEPER